MSVDIFSTLEHAEQLPLGFTSPDDRAHWQAIHQIRAPSEPYLHTICQRSTSCDCDLCLMGIPPEGNPE